jgi:hypothetical protein
VLHRAGFDDIAQLWQVSLAVAVQLVQLVGCGLFGVGSVVQGAFCVQHGRHCFQLTSLVRALPGWQVGALFVMLALSCGGE